MTNISSTYRYDAAEKLLEEAESYREPDTRAEWCLGLAKMHLALSQASLAARPSTVARRLPPHQKGQRAPTAGHLPNPPLGKSPP
jgi:hypothetical protein